MAGDEQLARLVDSVGRVRRTDAIFSSSSIMCCTSFSLDVSDSESLLRISGESSCVAVESSFFALLRRIDVIV